MTTREKIELAIKSKSNITFDYQKSIKFEGGTTSHRTITPENFEEIGQLNSICVTGFCHLRNDKRTFNIDRISNLVLNHKKTELSKNDIIHSNNQNFIFSENPLTIIPYRINKLWYFFNLNQNKIISSEGFLKITPIDITFTKTKSYIATGQNNKHAIISCTKDINSTYWVDEYWIFQLDKFYINIKLNNKQSILTTEGVFLAPLIFDSISPLRTKSYNLFKIELNNKFGLIDTKKFETIIPIEYDSISHGHDDLVEIKEGQKIGLFDLKSKNIVVFKHGDYIKYLNEHMCSFKSADNKYLIFNIKSDYFLDNNYDIIHLFIDGFAVCNRNNNYYLVSKNGQEIEIEDLPVTNNDFSFADRYENCLVFYDRYSGTNSREMVHNFYFYKGLNFTKKITEIGYSRGSIFGYGFKDDVFNFYGDSKYGGAYTISQYDINGNKIKPKKNTTDTKTNKKTNTNCYIKENILYHKNTLIHKISDVTLSGDGYLTADLELELPLLIEGLCDEDGCNEIVIGYFDHNGNTYWEDNNETKNM